MIQPTSAQLKLMRARKDFETRYGVTIPPPGTKPRRDTQSLPHSSSIMRLNDHNFVERYAFFFRMLEPKPSPSPLPPPRKLPHYAKLKRHNSH